MDKRTPILMGRNISITYRMGNRYYDRELAPYQIGCGQQFFLLRIYENQGISVLDLARMGQFDKGTTTRAVQRLEELGYIRSEPDGRDKRVRRLYTTPATEPIVKAAAEARQRWHAILTRGMSPQEVAQAAQLLEKIAQNAYSSMEQEEQTLESR